MLVSLELNAAAVLDLRNSDLRRILRIGLDEIIETDWRRENRRSREAATQAWGAAFAAAAIEAVIAPSAALETGTNVVVFPRNLQDPDEFFVEREIRWP